MMSVPAGAQDGRRPAKAQPRRTAPKVQPKRTAPKAQPPAESSAGADDEDAPAAPPGEVDAEVEAEPEQPPEASTPSEEAADVERDAAAADAELGPEDAVSPDNADDEISPEEREPAAKRPRERAGKRPRHRRPPPASSAKGAKRERPNELEYIEGMDVPDGYMLVERTRTGLVIAGGVTFGVGYLAAVTAAVASSDERHEGCFGGGYARGDYEGGWHDEEVAYCVEGAENEDFVPLYIPIVGPFIAMGTLEHADGGMRAALLLDGVVQIGGAAMFIAGLAAPKTVLLRTEHASMSVAPGPGSLQLLGSF